MVAIKRLSLLVLFGLLAAACGAVPVQARSLSLAYHGGDVYTYKLTSVSKRTVEGATSATTEVQTTATESIKVQSVDSSGVADLTITLSNYVLKTISGGLTNTLTGIPDSAREARVAPDGTVLSMDGVPSTAGNPMQSFTFVGQGLYVTAVLPSGAVKPGDTWSKDYRQAGPGGAGAIQVTSQSKYLRDESVNGVNAAVVETTSKATLDMSIGPVPGASAQPSSSPNAASSADGMSIQGTESTDVTTWIDVSDHRILKSHSTETDDGTMTWHITSTNPLPMMSGPITVRGTATTNLDPV